MIRKTIRALHRSSKRLQETEKLLKQSRAASSQFWIKRLTNGIDQNAQ